MDSVRQYLSSIFCLLLLSNPEERARIYSSDSDEGSDEDKAQRLMKAKKLDSDEVGVMRCTADRGQYDAGHWGIQKPISLK